MVCYSPNFIYRGIEIGFVDHVQDATGVMASWLLQNKWLKSDGSVFCLQVRLFYWSFVYIIMADNCCPFVGFVCWCGPQSVFQCEFVLKFWGPRCLVFFFVVVVPFVFVGGVVLILSLTRCVLIFLIKNPSLVLFHLETWMLLFFVVVVPILAFVFVLF